jgi:hypothetical protein
VYTWGIFSFYVTGYLRSFSPSLKYADTIIIYGCQIGAQVRISPCTCLRHSGGDNSMVSAMARSSTRVTSVRTRLDLYPHVMVVFTVISITAGVIIMDTTCSDVFLLIVFRPLPHPLVGLSRGLTATRDVDTDSGRGCRRR